MKKRYLLLLLFSLTACLQDQQFSLPYLGYTPLDQNDNWQLASPAAEQMDSSLLEQAYELVYSDERFLMARSLLVFRNGKLVAEAYPNDLDDIQKIYPIQSCTQSITSILVGAALQQQLLDSIQTPLYDYYPNEFDTDNRKQTITLEDALKMQAGLAFDNSRQTKVLYTTKGSSVGYVLQQDYKFVAGTQTKYNNGAPQLVSAVLSSQTQQPLVDFARQNLFTPLGIEHWQWENAKDGTTFGAFGLQLRPRDLGKIGQLLLQKGSWNNQQWIDSSYLAEATQIHTYLPAFATAPYGYYFWIIPQYHAYAMVGDGGQFVLVAPDQNLVAVYTAGAYTNPAFFDNRMELIDLLIKSCN